MACKLCEYLYFAFCGSVEFRHARLMLASVATPEILKVRLLKVSSKLSGCKERHPISIAKNKVKMSMYLASFK